MRQIAVAVTIGATLCGVLPAYAHPHVFIDAGIEVLFNASGQAEALQITWVYDDLYSMLVIGERGLDPDFDGVLTPAEQAALSGFDMNWDADFPGDTYAILGTAPIALSRPEEWTADFSDNRLRSTHVRRFAKPVDMGTAPLVVQVYDPSFYTSYTVALPSVLTGAPGTCQSEVFTPDRAAADAVLAAAMQEYSGTEGLEGDFPAVGAAYAEEVRVTCVAP